MSFIDSHDWCENIICPLSKLDLDSFQNQLNDVVGVEPDGTLRWRIVWGQNFDTTAMWDRYKGEWRLRYQASFTIDYVANPAGVLEPKKTWFGVPRFFIEAMLPRIHRNENAESAGVDPDGDVFTERRLSSPEYMTMFCVTEHSNETKDGWRLCCLDRVKNGQTCYGRYRPPDDADIDMLSEDYHQRVTSKMCRPDEKPRAEDKAFFYNTWMLDQMRDEQKRSDELDYSRKDILSTLTHWSGSNFDSKKNRFSIPTV